MKSEESLGEYREEDQTAGQDCLHAREGASASASMCSPHANSARIHPIANHGWRNRSAALRSGCRTSIGRASTARRALSRELKLVPNAHTSAKLRPRIIANAAVCLARARVSIRYPQASATPDHELVALIARSLVAALDAAVS
jgi:hypothetical protein